MDEIGVGEAEHRIRELLDRAEAGEQIVITRSGRAIARLMPPIPAAGVGQAGAHAAADAIRTLREGARLGGLTIRDLITEGRR